MGLGFKAIFCDYSETLVGPERSITTKVREAIAMWVESGRTFTIVTGNQYSYMKEIFLELGLKSPEIVRGGAEIVDPISGSIIRQKYIRRNQVARVITLFKKHEVHFNTEFNDVIYTSKRSRIHRKKKFRHIDDMYFIDVPKILVILEHAKEEEIVRSLLRPFPNLLITKHRIPEGTSLEVSSIDADKGKAVSYLIQSTGLLLDETVGIGSSFNDIPLWRHTGLAIATRNAPDGIKKIVDYVAPSYKRDGVAKVIWMIWGTEYGQMELI